MGLWDSVVYYLLPAGFQHRLEWYWRTRLNFLQVSEWAAQVTRSLPPVLAFGFATLEVDLQNLVCCMLSDAGPPSLKLPCRRSKMSISSTSILELCFQCLFLSSTQCTGCFMWYEGPVSLPLKVNFVVLSFQVTYKSVNYIISTF